MPNKIIYDNTTGIHKVRVSGIITIDDILETISELKRQGIADTLIYVLVDTLRETSELSILDVETLASAHPGRNRIKSAILTSSDHINLSGHELLEKKAAEKGKSIRIFTNKELALEWLLGNE